MEEKASTNNEKIKHFKPANEHVNSFGTGYTGGPHNVGDPNDMTMRHVESFVLVTNIVKDRAHVEKCQEQIKKWGRCMENAGYGSFITCRNEIKEMNDCLRYWYTSKEFRKECEEIYLAKRKRFRETGIVEKDPKTPYYVPLKKSPDYKPEHKAENKS